MSHTVNARKDVPNAPCYVLSNDSFMSGWGEARDKTTTIILPCASYEQAQIVFDNAKARTDQKNVRIVAHKPRFRSGVLYSLLTIDTSSAWFEPGQWRNLDK